MLDTGQQTERDSSAQSSTAHSGHGPHVSPGYKACRCSCLRNFKEEQGLELGAKEEEAQRVQESGTGYSGRQLL